MMLLIGYGNPLCGDDGVGPYIIEQLCVEEPLRTNIQYCTVRQLTPEIAEPISKADAVVFVDASDSVSTGIPAGHITYNTIAYDPKSELAIPGSGAFTHHVNPETLLYTAYQLYGRCPTGYLFTIAGTNFGLGDSFSPAVEAALPVLLNGLKARIAYYARI